MYLFFIADVSAVWSDKKDNHLIN